MYLNVLFTHFRHDKTLNPRAPSFSQRLIRDNRREGRTCCPHFSPRALHLHWLWGTIGNVARLHQPLSSTPYPEPSVLQIAIQKATDI